MKTVSNIFSHIDWPLLVLYAMLVVFGWFNIYSVSYEPAFNQNIFDLSYNAGKQFIWITVNKIFLAEEKVSNSFW